MNIYLVIDNNPFVKEYEEYFDKYICIANTKEDAINLHPNETRRKFKKQMSVELIGKTILKQTVSKILLDSYTMK